ncbi:hypothetical protein WEH80_13915 [Actinomycetes bacterium KLBMP 9759]
MFPAVNDRFLTTSNAAAKPTVTITPIVFTHGRPSGSESAATAADNAANAVRIVSDRVQPPTDSNRCTAAPYGVDPSASTGRAALTGHEDNIISSKLKLNDGLPPRQASCG